jgi:hypothetical protein
MENLPEFTRTRITQIASDFGVEKVLCIHYFNNSQDVLDKVVFNMSSYEDMRKLGDVFSAAGYNVSGQGHAVYTGDKEIDELSHYALTVRAGGEDVFKEFLETLNRIEHIGELLLRITPQYRHN